MKIYENVNFLKGGSWQYFSVTLKMDKRNIVV